MNRKWFVMPGTSKMNTALDKQMAGLDTSNAALNKWSEFGASQMPDINRLKASMLGSLQNPATAGANMRAAIVQPGKWDIGERAAMNQAKSRQMFANRGLPLGSMQTSNMAALEFGKNRELADLEGRGAIAGQAAQDAEQQKYMQALQFLTGIANPASTSAAALGTAGQYGNVANTALQQGQASMSPWLTLLQILGSWGTGGK